MMKEWLFKTHGFPFIPHPSAFILAFVRRVYLSWGTLSKKASALYEAADFSG
jgi:hypothetical protein